MTQFISENYFEILASILGLLFIYLEIKENKWLWLVGVISPLLYIYVFFNEKLYATMTLQFYYMVISVYGWFMWTRNKNTSNNKTLDINHLTPSLGLKLLIINLIIFTLVSFILIKYTDASQPYLDALASSLSIVAYWMLTQKILEQWLVWLVADTISMGLYIYKGLYPTSILFFVYCSLAIIGYIKWKKSMEKKHETPMTNLDT